MEGMALARTIALNEPTKPDYDAVPSAVFSHPELAGVVSEGCAFFYGLAYELIHELVHIDPDTLSPASSHLKLAGMMSVLLMELSLDYQTPCFLCHHIQSWQAW